MTDAVAIASLPRPRGRVLAQAALVLWLPALLPLVTGMLHDCGHCCGTYCLMLPLVPGVILPVLTRLDGAWFFVVAALPVLVQGFVLYSVGREAPRRVSTLVGAVVAIGVAAQSIGFANAIRQ